MKNKSKSKKILLIIMLIMIGLCLYGSWIGFSYKYTINTSQVVYQEGNAYLCLIDPLKLFVTKNDDMDHPNRAKAILLEQGVPIGKPHAVHSEIRMHGKGLYSYWMRNLYFSSSDNSDPRYNGKIYQVVIPYFLNPMIGNITAFVLILGLVIYFFTLMQHNLKPINFNFLKIFLNPQLSKHFLTKKLCIILSFVILNTMIWVWLKNSFGVLFWVGLGLFSVITLYLLFSIARIIGFKNKALFLNLSLVVASISIALLGLESWLYLEEKLAVRIAQPAASTQQQNSTLEQPMVAYDKRLSIPISSEAQVNIVHRRKLKTMPIDWELKTIQIPGSYHTVQWHGVIHVHDQNGFRRKVPFPPKKPDVFRVLVIGDSLTYGWGIDEKFTFTKLLQDTFEKDFKVEFLNLGNNGAQSEDELNNIKKFVSLLKPNLVIYGMCQNDFLPSQTGVYSNGVVWKFLPKPVHSYFLRHSLLARFVNDHCHKLLLKYGLVMDFYDDILSNFSDYQKRFEKDVLEMNQYVMACGLPPIVAMVLDPIPACDSREHEVTKVAEKFMKSAGMNVIETETFYRQYNGKDMRVSNWEEHPNEEANAIFASMFYDRMKDLQALKSFRFKKATSLKELNGEKGA